MTTNAEEVGKRKISPELTTAETIYEQAPWMLGPARLK
jgi:hypothetical protein